MKYEHYLCTVAIGSVTDAMKAERILSRAAIPSDVVKVDKTRKKSGCIYGVSFACSQDSNVRSLLTAASINIKESK